MFTWLIEVSKEHGYFVIFCDFAIRHVSLILARNGNACARMMQSNRYRSPEISEEYGKIGSKHVLFFCSFTWSQKNDSVQWCFDSATIENSKGMMVMRHDECLWLFYIYVVSLINKLYLLIFKSCVFQSLVFGPRSTCPVYLGQPCLATACCSSNNRGACPRSGCVRKI